jgi:hypothetical protein
MIKKESVIIILIKVGFNTYLSFSDDGGRSDERHRAFVGRFKILVEKDVGFLPGRKLRL